MSQINVTSITKVMASMADDLRARAAEIDKCAAELTETGNLDEVVVALAASISTQNLAAHQLLNVVIRELQRSPKQGEQ